MDIGGRRAETLLALLGVRAGSPVSIDTLTEEIWAGEPPEGAATTLRSYVSRLRTALGDIAPIEHGSAGYALRAPAGSVDISVFEALVREGADLMQRGRHRRAVTALREALALWRGRPFAGLPEDGTFVGEVVRLEELRLRALELRFEGDLELGRAEDLVDELEALVAEHPFRERLWRHLMLALFRAGRQADALAAYHRARAALDEHLGIEPTEELRGLEAAILRQEVPRAAGRSDATARVPIPLTTFVGRTRELDEIRDLMQRARLVTVVGVGGVGKTRLALEIARRAVEDGADAVAFVDLAALSDPSLVASHVAAAVGVNETPGHEVTPALADHVRSRELLLVLDNCEHVRSAAADLAQLLLRASADLRILATSRETLEVPGEARFPLSPLTLPGPDEAPAALRDSEAVRLLVERATLTRPDLPVDDAAYELAARICRELDGLPLAIELAAARANALSLAEIAERLRDRFRFLVSWRRLSAARHRTLREAMDWSYDLLAPDEQRLLAALSVFPAGATLASVAAVCLSGDEDEAARLIERLADASLVAPIDHPAGTRYRLLETVRQYAAEQVPEAERAPLARRLAEHARAIAVSTNLSLEGTGSAMSFDLARLELPSIRAAIAWATDADPTLALEIACALERFWVTNHTREGINVFTSLLAKPGVSDALRARALRCRGGCRYYTADFEGGAEDYEQALAIHRRLGERAYVAHLEMRLAIEAHRGGDPGRARELLEASMTAGEDRFPADRYVSLGLSSELAFDVGDLDGGFRQLHEAVALSGELGDAWWQSDTFLQLADRAHERGRPEDVGPAARGALRIALTIHDRQTVIWAVALLARDAAANGLSHRAGRLWGGLAAEVDRGGPVGQWELEEEALGAEVAELAGDGFELGTAEGRSMGLDEVAAEALRPS